MNIRMIMALSVLTALGIQNVAYADPPVNTPPGHDPIPSVFCFRVMDIERVVTGDGSNNDFVLDFEVLNWTATPADGVFVALNTGTTTNAGTAPNFLGLGIDRDGRGGPLGGADIDASGAGLTVGSGTFDFPAVQSGRGRGDIPASLNDWTPTTLGTPILGAFAGLGTLSAWSSFGATAIPFRDLVGASAPGGILPVDLVPGLGLDALGDSAIDGGPGPYTAGPGSGPPIPDGSGNVLDGFTITVQDWDIGEVLSFNWFLQDAAGLPIGTAGGGNAFGFGVMNLIRMPVGGALPGGLFQGNSGFNQNPNTFFDGVFNVPNPAEFSAEFGAAITAPFANPNDNIFNAPINAVTIPEPSTFLLATIAVPLLMCRSRRRKMHAVYTWS